MNIDQIIAENRLLSMLHERVIESPYFDQKLYNTIKQYITSYLASQQKESSSPEEVYFRFIRSYNQDMKAFAKTGKYPLEIVSNGTMPSRYEYDIILLFSCLFASHRFRIMQLIQQKSKVSDNGLFIGCGPGLEFALVKSKINHLFAYDLSINPFLLKKHPEIHFKEAYFTGDEGDKQYDSVYLIELLEHLEHPYQLLHKCQQVLTKNGTIYLTTATNIPQFDHLYNFESSHEDFEQQVDQLGLQITYMEDIPHQSITLDILAKNRFYVLTRN